MDKFYWEPTREETAGALRALWSPHLAAADVVSALPARSCGRLCRWSRSRSEHAPGDVVTSAASAGHGLPIWRASPPQRGCLPPACRLQGALLDAPLDLPVTRFGGPSSSQSLVVPFLVDSTVLQDALLDAFPDQPMDFFGAIKARMVDCSVRDWLRGAGQQARPGRGGGGRQRAARACGAAACPPAAAGHVLQPAQRACCTHRLTACYSEPMQCGTGCFRRG